LEDGLRAEGFDVSVYRSNRGYEADSRQVQPLVEAAVEARKYLLGAPPDRIHPHCTNTWNDLNAFLEVGVPQ
jgi:hypothetical protein